MLTYSLSNAVASKNKEDDDTERISAAVNVFTVIWLLIIFILIIFAWMRALKCSNPNPDSKAVHLLFATVDPLAYLIFSYIVNNMCAKK